MEIVTICWTIVTSTVSLWRDLGVLCCSWCSEGSFGKPTACLPFVAMSKGEAKVDRHHQRNPGVLFSYPVETRLCKVKVRIIKGSCTETQWRRRSGGYDGGAAWTITGSQWCCRTTTFQFFRIPQRQRLFLNAEHVTVLLQNLNYF